MKNCSLRILKHLRFNSVIKGVIETVGKLEQLVVTFQHVIDIID